MINKQELIIKMLSNPYIKSFVEKHELSNAYLLDHMSSLIDSYASLEKCANCKGLDKCSQAKKGEYVSLSFDGSIYNEVTYCKLYLAKLDEEKRLSNFIRNDIPEVYKDLTLNDVQIFNKTHEKLFAECLDILNGSSKQGLFIYGDMGVGKTYMCIALANSLSKANKKVAFVKTGAFVNDCRYLIGIDSKKIDKMINDLKEVDYLILDDIGSESVSSYSRDDLLFNILDYRMEEKKTTIFTSNLTKNALLEHYKFDKKDNTSELRAKRLLERIDILGKDLCLEGDNKRRS